MIRNCALSIKEVHPAVHVTLVRPNIMQKLDIIIQLKFQNHRNTIKAIWTTVLHGLLFQILQKMVKPGRS